MVVPTAELAPPALLLDHKAEKPPAWERGLDIVVPRMAREPPAPSPDTGWACRQRPYLQIGMFTSRPGAGLGYGGALGAGPPDRWAGSQWTPGTESATAVL